MRERPSAVGARAELAVAAAGKLVYLPFFGADSRVDLVFQDETGFHRVQCKTSRCSGDVVTFSTCSNTTQVRKDYRGEIDLFGVYSPDLGQVFLVPVEDTPTRLCTLRLGQARNRQMKGVRWANQYLLREAVPYHAGDGRGLRPAGDREEVAGPVAGGGRLPGRR